MSLVADKRNCRAATAATETLLVPVSATPAEDPGASDVATTRRFKETIIEMVSQMNDILL